MEIINKAAKKHEPPPWQQTFLHPCLDWTASGICCVCLGIVSVAARPHARARVCFVYAQVSCVLTDERFPSIFEQSVLASFPLEALLVLRVRGEAEALSPARVWLPFSFWAERFSGSVRFRSTTAARKQTSTAYMLNIKPPCFIYNHILEFWDAAYES